MGIESVTGDALANQEVGMHSFAGCLKDGQVLCKLINSLSEKPLISKINTQTMAFKQMENIEKFLKACKKYGLQDGDLFQTADLYETQNMSQVLQTITACSSVATSKHGYEGMCIGVKLSEENAREFDQATIDAGKAILGGQTGWNKGETQAGMSMGKARKVIDM